MGKIRTAVVGLSMGLAHAHAYKRADRSELSWVVDLDEEKAKKVAGELGCNYTKDWTSIIDDVDAISFATPHHLHAPYALQAIEAGKHVLIEKPLANSEEDCLKLIKAADEKNVRLMIAYVIRYVPTIRRLKEAIDSGKYGTPINAQGWVQAYLAPTPGSWISRIETLGGGVLFSHGCHYIDILLYLFGDPERVAHFGTRIGTEWMEGEGTSHALIQFKNGVIANLSSSWGMKVTRPPAKYQIHTTTGLIQVENMDKVEYITREGAEVIYERPADFKNFPGGNVIYEIEHFLECIANGARPETDGVEALRSHRTIWAMYESQGVPVNL